MDVTFYSLLGIHPQFLQFIFKPFSGNQQNYARTMEWWGEKGTFPALFSFSQS